MMRYTSLQVERNGPTLTVTVDRPAALNALARSVLSELADVFETVPTLAGLRSVVLSGAGERAFVAGADIREMSAMDRAEAESFGALGQRVTTLIEGSPVPVIAAVNGYALGGGCELVLACHWALATANAVFGQPEVSLGLIPGFGGCVRLQRLVGPSRAREMICTGRQIDADEALRIGLVTQVLPDRAALDAAVAASVALVAERSPVAVRLSLRAMAAAAGRPVDEGLRAELVAFGEAFTGEEMREGTAAFLAKRPPAFSGG